MEHITHSKKLKKNGKLRNCFVFCDPCSMSRGASIVELLVVVVIIILVFFTIGISNFSKIRSQFSLSVVAHAFLQDVRQAQTMSLTSAQYKGVDGKLKPITGYGVYLDMSQHRKYVIYASAPGFHQYYDRLSDYVVNTVDFSQTDPGIIIKQTNNLSEGVVSINFAPPSPTTIITPMPPSGRLDVVFALESNPSITKTVSVNLAGLIEIKE